MLLSAAGALLVWTAWRGAQGARPPLQPTAYDAQAIPQDSDFEAGGDSAQGPPRAAAPAEEVRTDGARGERVDLFDATLHAFEIVALDAMTGGPLEGCSVWLRSSADAGAEPVEVTTDAEGRALARVPFARADVLVASRFHVDASRPGVPATAKAPCVIELETSGAVVGRVDVAGGTPLEEARVLLGRGSTTGRRMRPIRVAEIGPGGAFRFEDVAPGLVHVALTAADAPALLEPAIHVEPGVESFVVLRVPERVRFQARLRALRSRDPVAGAELRFVSIAERGGPEVPETPKGVVARTASDGECVVPALIPGRYFVDIVLPWGGTAERQVQVIDAGAARVVDLFVPGPARIVGQVRDSEGRSVGGLQVSLAQQDGIRTADWLGTSEDVRVPGDVPVQRTVTDANGAFEFLAVPSGRRLVVVATRREATGARPGAVAALAPLSPGEVRDFELRMAAVATVAGRVVDRAGSPIAGAQVRADLLRARAELRLARVDSDSEGRFELEGLPTEGARLDVRAEGFHRRTLPVATVVEHGGRVELERELVARGIVVDEYGDAVPAAAVRVSEITEDDRAGTRRSTRCDPWGRFRIDRLRPGAWRIEVFAQGFRHVEAEGLVVQLAEDAEPALRLTMERRAAPPLATVTGEVVTAGSGASIPDVDFGGIGRASVVVDGTRFRIVGLAPGRARLHARAPGYESLRLEAVDLAPGAVVDIGRVELRRATRLEIAVWREGGGVLADAKVRLERLPRKEAGRAGLPRVLHLTHQGGGLYFHDSTPRAKWRLVVQHPSAGRATREVDVRGARRRIRVELAR